MKTANQIIVTSALMNTTVNSPAVPLQDIYGYAVQALYTGTPTGALKLQASCDAFKYAHDVNPQTPQTWTDVTDSSFSITSAGSYVWNVTGAFYSFFRVVYTDGSGGSSTARLTITVNVKGA